MLTLEKIISNTEINFMNFMLCVILEIVLYTSNLMYLNVVNILLLYVCLFNMVHV